MKPLNAASGGPIATGPQQPNTVHVFVETLERAPWPRRLVKTLARRRRLFALVFGGVFTAVMLFTLIVPRDYTVMTKMLAGAWKSSEPGPSGIPVQAQMTTDTLAELLSETPIEEKVIADLELPITPQDLTTHVRIVRVPGTPVLTMYVTWHDPATAAAIANDLANVFVRREREFVSKQTDAAVTAYGSELPEAEHASTVAETALTAYEQQTGISDLTTATTTQFTARAALEAKYKESQDASQSAKASLARTNQQIAQTAPTVEGARNVAQNPIVAQLQATIATDKVKLKALQQEYQDGHPLVLQTQAELAGAEQQLAAQPASVTASVATNPNPVYEQLQQSATQYGQAADAASAQMAAIEQQLRAGKPALDALPDESRRLVDLQRDYKIKQDRVDTIAAQLQTVELARKSALSDIAITQSADAHDTTSTPNTLTNAIAGGLAGLILAFGAVFLGEIFDDRLRTQDDVRDRLGLPVLATIPMIEGGDDAAALPSGRRRDNDWIRPLSVESFYQLVASLRYTSSSPPRTIGFTSATPGDGKSTIAVNTAISMALMKARVLIIDADLRRPSVHAKLEVPNGTGLSDVLVGLADFEDVLTPTSHEGVWVVTSGRRVPSPVALLQSEAFDRFLRAARERFDFVIVDGPALTSIVDGVVIGFKTEGTVLIVNASSTNGRSAQLALAKLRAVPAINVIGVVINGTRPDPSDFSDYYLGEGRTIALPGAIVK